MNVSTRKQTADRPASFAETTREQQKKKYEFDKKYHAVPHDLSQGIDNRYSVSHWYGRRFEYEKIRTLTEFCRKANLDLSQMRILDIGCHRGRIANLWAELAGSARYISGCDFIPAFIQTASAINPGIDYFRHDLYQPLPRKRGVFDCISLLYAYNCIPVNDQPLIARHLDKALAPGGSIILFDFYDSWIVRLRQTLVTFLRRVTGKAAKAYLPRFSTARIRALFPGYTVVATRRCMNTWSYPLLKAGSLTHDILDGLLPGEYYGVLLKKPAQDPLDY